ncbi:hypothetical protein QFZ79_000121 [Arthrobacter sp. V4I6]|nr:MULTISPECIES: hypothetical protein [unclassified Arthrobacter]MDQ0822384.1 hypothetical protein [Arthrobacter sp. V1I7]MDQ0852010.1 hypothetical protein [Arthrobacter sp. V4I6]
MEVFVVLGVCLADEPLYFSGSFLSYSSSLIILSKIRSQHGDGQDAEDHAN